MVTVIKLRFLKKVVCNVFLNLSVGVPTSPTSLTVNNLLLGKSAIVSTRGRRLGPPPGAVPPSRQSSACHDKSTSRSRNTNDTISWTEAKSRRTLDRRNSVKWKDLKKEKTLELGRKPSIDLDEQGDGIIVSEIEANAMIASIRSRSSSESSTYSSHSGSSTDTSLCDENEGASESEVEVGDDKENEKVDSKAKQSTSSTSQIKTPSVVKESIVPTLTSPKKASSPHIESISNVSDPHKPIRPDMSNLNLNLSSTTDSYQYNTNKHSSYVPSIRTMKETKSNFSATNFTALSPVDLSPYHNINLQKSSFCYDFEANLRRPSTSKIDINARPPDLIDSFTMYPNFVPDIDISDKYMSDLDSPTRSQGSDTAVVSEDEPPIPLRIDKYFENSPEFFGARLTDPNNDHIPSRRPTKRNSRIPKKPDSLTLKTNNNERMNKSEAERASSLPQPHTFVCKKSVSPDIKEFMESKNSTDIETPTNSKVVYASTPVKEATVDSKIKTDYSPKEYMLQSGRKNSERALQIIQENSQILSRILTKQNVTSTNVNNVPSDLHRELQSEEGNFKDDQTISKSLDSPLLKESTSDSLIGAIRRKPSSEVGDRSDFLRARPISIDDPFSFETRKKLLALEECTLKNLKSPSSDCLGNKTDLYGWENKGFLAKYDYKNTISESDDKKDVVKLRKMGESLTRTDTFPHTNLKPVTEYNRYSFSGDSKTFATQESSELKDTSSYERRFTSDDYNYPISTSSKYNDYVLSKVSDICSKTIDNEPKNCENAKTESSQLSDFSQKVTSSISFTYEPSLEDDSPMGAKSNSSDTLCQITSLDQVSTPISPKTFPNRDTLSCPKDYAEKYGKTRIESDDTCSAITSLLETDTLSSLSYPRSPSSSSYYPFPTRPALRTPKDFGVKLGLYPKETVTSSPK